MSAGYTDATAMAVVPAMVFACLVTLFVVWIYQQVRASDDAAAQLEMQASVVVDAEWPRWPSRPGRAVYPSLPRSPHSLSDSADAANVASAMALQGVPVAVAMRARVADPARMDRSKFEPDIQLRIKQFEFLQFLASTEGYSDSGDEHKNRPGQKPGPGGKGE